MAGLAASARRVRSVRPLSGQPRPPTPLAAQEIEQINALVKEAMGFNATRGDSLNVVNTAFNAPDREVIAETPWWRQPSTISTAKEVGRYAVFAALIAYFVFGLLRP